MLRPETAAADEYGSSSAKPVDAKDNRNAGKVNNLDGNCKRPLQMDVSETSYDLSNAVLAFTRTRHFRFSS